MSSSTVDRNEEAFGADFPAVLLALAVFVELQILLVFSFTSHASLQFQKVPEGLFSIPPFLEGHLAMVMEGRTFFQHGVTPFMHCATKKSDVPPLARNLLSCWAASPQTTSNVIKGN